MESSKRICFTTTAFDRENIEKCKEHYGMSYANVIRMAVRNLADSVDIIENAKKGKFGAEA